MSQVSIKVSLPPKANLLSTQSHGLPHNAPASTCSEQQKCTQSRRERTAVKASTPIIAGSGAFKCSSMQETQTPSNMASHTDGPRTQCLRPVSPSGVPAWAVAALPDQ